jgi:hypothetical protein
MSTSSYQYYMVIVDDFSHYFWCFPLVTKSDAFATIQFFSHVDTQFCTPIRAFQTDNGKEFVNHTSSTFFDSHGVQLHLPCPYSSPQNGKAERAIRTMNPPAIPNPWHGHTSSQAIRHSTLIFPSPCFQLPMLSQCDGHHTQQTTPPIHRLCLCWLPIHSSQLPLL